MKFARFAALIELPHHRTAQDCFPDGYWLFGWKIANNVQSLVSINGLIGNVSEPNKSKTMRRYKILFVRVCEFPSFRVSEFPSFRVSEFESLRV